MSSTNGTQFDGIDFAVGVVRGVRAWDVTEGILTGVVYHQRWTPGENHALCRKNPDRVYMYVPPIPGHVVPVPPSRPDSDYQLPAPGHLFTCMCGFYAYYDGSNDYFKGDYSNTRRVTGVIEGYGETLVGTRGFRCTKARIVALYVVDHFVGDFELIRANYPLVPVFDTFEAMLREFPEEDGGAREKYLRDVEAAALASLDDNDGENQAT